MDMWGNESSCVIENEKIDRLDLPKKGHILGVIKKRHEIICGTKSYPIVCN